MSAAPKPRRHRADGERSRAAILDAAAKLATVEGLDGLSIARLAQATGMSKSGLFAHFGSKEDLQLATVETAARIFTREVIEPGLAHDTPLARVEGLCEAFLSHLERSVFPGGCFFASTGAELDTRPGPVRDRITAVLIDWDELLTRQVAEAQEAGELRSGEDPAQLAFELNALMSFANTIFLLMNEPGAMQRARAALAARIDQSRAAPVSRPSAAKRR